MTHLTWGVDKKNGTATIFCMQCRATFNTVSLSEVSFELIRVEQSGTHHCIPTKPWKVIVSRI